MWLCSRLEVYHPFWINHFHPEYSKLSSAREFWLKYSLHMLTWLPLVAYCFTLMMETVHSFKTWVNYLVSHSKRWSSLWEPHMSRCNSNLSDSCGWCCAPSSLISSGFFCVDRSPADIEQRRGGPRQIRVCCWECCWNRVLPCYNAVCERWVRVHLEKLIVVGTEHSHAAVLSVKGEWESILRSW